MRVQYAVWGYIGDNPTGGLQIVFEPHYMTPLPAMYATDKD